MSIEIGKGCYFCRNHGINGGVTCIDPNVLSEQDTRIEIKPNGGQAIKLDGSWRQCKSDTLARINQ